MAASSSSFSSSQISYDVFVSFRGPDVRCGFLSHLLNAFHEKSIRIDAYVDERLQKGEEVSPALLRAIEESQISLIIFSPNYASSKWCLDELVKIIECKEQNSQIVIPVFYQIEPSDVRHQTGNYGIPFAEHEKRYDTIRVQNWKASSKKAANLSGFPLSNFKSEAAFIEEIVKFVVKNLDNKKIQKYYKKFVGLDRRIAKAESLLCRGSKKVCIVGIWGPGGIGKSTIAEALFNKLLFEYRGCCCVINLREELEKSKITDIKMKLCSQLLKENFDEIFVTLALPSYVARRLQQTKALILLDDVYESEYLKILIHEGKDLFGQGSVIIVTSRDKQVLRNIAGDNIYEVEALNDVETLQLFSLSAFKQENPETDWIELSNRAVRYAHGNPLALTVLGSSLFELKPKEWESQLKRLGKMPCEGIQKVLRLSYDRLDPHHKKFFLFLACFFCVEELPKCPNIESLLDACGFSTLFGLKILANKSLIKFTKDHVWMHSLIQEMGQEVAREESCDKLGKQSHLWDAYDINQVLMNDTGSKAIKSIVLDISSQMHLRLKPHVFEKMVNLKLLKFYGNEGYCTLQFPKGLKSLPNQLRLLHWEGYPLKSLPSTFSAENLVELNMPHSKVEKLWDGVQHLVNMKKIYLSDSKHLIELPDLSKASNLELINLSNCCSLVEVHESSLSLPQLKELYLSGCMKLKSLRSDVSLKSLRHLELDECESIEDFSVISEPMENLSVKGCKSLRYLPKELSKLRSLQGLILHNCINLEPSSLRILLNCSESLTCLHLNNCYKLGELPKNIPPSFKHFSRLTNLCLSNCWNLQYISGLPPSITALRIYNCGRLRSIVGLPTSIQSLTAENCESLETVTSFASLLIFQSRFDILSKSSRLSFRNCINLDENAVNNIMTFVHCKIKQLSYEISCANYVEVCLPGWKVPDWFRHRARGASMTISLDISAESMCIGFICCIIVSDFQPNKAYPDCGWEFRCYIEASDDQKILSYKYDYEFFDVEDTKMGFQLVSDHMYLGYHLESFSNVLEMRANDHSGTHEKRVSLQFEVADQCGQLCPMIRECGVHPIYALEYFNSDELLYLKKNNRKFIIESRESKFNCTLPPAHKTLVSRATETWKNEAGGLKQLLEF